MRCSNCQELLLEDDLFCENCGERVVQLTNQSVAQQVVPENKKQMWPWLLGLFGVIILVSLMLCFGVAYLIKTSLETSLETSLLVEPPLLVETSPLEDNSGGLTPQELAHEGTHTYEVICKFDGVFGSKIDFSSSLIFEFVEGGVNLQEGGDDYIAFYPKTGLNTYGGEIEYEIESCSLTFSDVNVWKKCPGAITCIYQRK